LLQIMQKRYYDIFIVDYFFAFANKGRNGSMSILLCHRVGRPAHILKQLLSFERATAVASGQVVVRSAK
jgi:hypothetical protein